MRTVVRGGGGLARKWRKTPTYYTTRLAGLMTSSLRHMSKIGRVVYQNFRADVTSPNLPTLTGLGENPATYWAGTEILAKIFFSS